MGIQVQTQLFLILALCLLSLQPSLAREKTSPLFGGRDIQLSENEAKVFEKNNITRVVVGNGTIVQAQVLDSGELLLIGLTEGTTTLQVWHDTTKRTRHRVTVAKAAFSQDIAMREIVSIKVRIVEFRESSLKRIGLKWNEQSKGPSFILAKDLISSQGSQLLNTIDTTSTFGSATPIFLGSQVALNSTIHFLQSTGHARTLAEPTLSCLSGETAHFLAGGEVPFAVTDSNGAPSVSFKEYGIQLDIKPKADRHGRIATEIATEVSNIDGTVSVLGAPGFLTRKTKTHMNVMSGQTIIIAGLLTQEHRTDVRFIPGLANLPFIGEFFQSKNFSKEERQLVIFVTPTLVDPIATVKSSRQNKAMDIQLQNILDQGMADILINIEGL